MNFASMFAGGQLRFELYGPSDLGASLAGSAAAVLPWVGVAVAAGLALFFVFHGIRQGLRFFSAVSGNRSDRKRDNQAFDDALFAQEYDWSKH